MHRAATIVVVPCFNEARRLNVHAFIDFLPSHPETAALFVDDGSNDDTPQVFEWLRQQLPRQVLTLRLPENVGKAEAVRQGVLAAMHHEPRYVGYWDADLATPLQAIPRFIEVLSQRPEVGLVMGSRVALLGRQIRRTARRHMLGRLFATAASFVLRLPVYDTQCGAKMFRASEATAAIFQEPFRTRWIFDVEILARLIASHPPSTRTHAAELIYEYPLERWEDVAGSRLKSHDFLTAALDLGSIFWQLRTATRPAQVRPVNADFPRAPAPLRRDAA
ncbi:MAG: glycosyltransferase [Pirellulales bacterium]|nr:glycosyltransferase [Pirellulales bacterium]